MKSGESLTLFDAALKRLTVKELVFTLFVSFFFYVILVPEEIMLLIIPGYQLDHKPLIYGLSLFVIVYCFLATKKRISHSLMAITFFSAFLVLVTWINAGDLGYAASMYIRVVAICFLAEYAFENYDTLLIRPICNALLLLVFANLLTVIMKPDWTKGALGSTFLLGFDNGIILILLPALVLNIILSVVQRKRVFSPRTVLSFALVCLTAILIDSSTTTVALLIFLVVFFMSNKSLPLAEKVSAPKIAVAISTLVFFLIVVFRFQNLFSVIINDLLGRDLTFTGRTALWDLAFQLIWEHPLLGNGFDPDAQRQIFFGVSSCHNQVLDVLYQTGLVGLIVFLLILVVYIKNGSCKVNKTYARHNRTIVAGALLAFLVAMQFESYSSYLGFGLLLALFVVYDQLSHASNN